MLKPKKLGAWGFGRVIASQSELSREEMSILREESVLQSNPYTQQADPAGEALLIPSQLPLLFIFHSVTTYSVWVPLTHPAACVTCSAVAQCDSGEIAS